ncbi:DUF805 domain-containing protein [Burkholderia stagnalis]
MFAFWTACAVGATRLHDIDKSGGWMLPIRVPIADVIALFAMNGLIAGTPHANRFGDAPPVGRDASASRDRA